MEFAEPLKIDSERKQGAEKTCFLCLLFEYCNTKTNEVVAGKMVRAEPYI